MRRGQCCVFTNLLVLTLPGSVIPLHGQERFPPESEREQRGEKSANEEWCK